MSLRQVTAYQADMTHDPCDLLRKIFGSAIDAAPASHCVPAHLTAPPAEGTVVLVAGKAAAGKAQVACREGGLPPRIANTLSVSIVRPLGEV